MYCVGSPKPSLYVPIKRRVFVEILAPINMLDASMNVLGPYTVKECVDIELMTTWGEDMYPAVPRPRTVDTREAVLT